MSGDQINMKNHQIKSAGFSLIELMVVVVIVAIFAAIAIPSYQTYITRAHKSKAQSEMLKVAERLENYKGKQLSYAGYIPEHQTSTKGQINIPYDAANNYDYRITVMDINDSTIALEDSVLGQGWRMIAMQKKKKNNALRDSEYLLLDSRGLRCATKYALTIASTDCGNASKDWK